jgi:P pilus assembly chaperone PapD
MQSLMKLLLLFIIAKVVVILFSHGLIQATVPKTGNIPFVVTPPLFKLAPGTDNLIRIVYLGSGLPADRESLLWLDVKGIPGLNEEESKASSRMVVAINNRIKFFYRPANLKGEPGEVAKNLTGVMKARLFQ